MAFPSWRIPEYDEGRPSMGPVEEVGESKEESKDESKEGLETSKYTAVEQD